MSSKQKKIWHLRTHTHILLILLVFQFCLTIHLPLMASHNRWKVMTAIFSLSPTLLLLLLLLNTTKLLNRQLTKKSKIAALDIKVYLHDFNFNLSSSSLFWHYKKVCKHTHKLYTQKKVTVLSGQIRPANSAITFFLILPSFAFLFFNTTFFFFSNRITLLFMYMNVNVKFVGSLPSFP